MATLELAQADRRLRGDLLAQRAIDAMVDDLLTRVELSNADRVGPAARKKLKGLIDFYRKKARPWQACVNDNTKRFGPEGAKKVCSVLKDLEMGTTKWRKGGGHKASMSLSEEFESFSSMVLDQELFDLLVSIADLPVGQEGSS